MICERCSTPMMPIYSPRDGWRYACVKCGAVRSGQPASCNEQAGEFAERGMNCFALQDFDEAQRNFAQAAQLDGDRPAYLWAMLLSQYGVRYCETGKGQYTVTFWKRDLPARLLTAQPEYRKLCRGAAGELEALRYYQQEAAEIDRGMQQVREAKREPYDVFLCFKDLDEHGPTPERQLCDGLYQELLERGLKVFYAPRTLFGKYVADYEASIHNALRDAKLLVVVASSGKNASSPWVESEWRRFQRWHQGGDRRLMTCVVGSMTPADFPKELQRYQCELYAREGQLSDRQTLEAIAARIERGCRGGKRRGSNRRAASMAMVAAAVVLVAGGVLAWRLLPSRGGSPAPEDAPVAAVVTEAPATEVPATEVPVTEAPATEAPVTEVPVTEVPATEVPATEVPVTAVPVTEAPTATPVPAPPKMRADSHLSDSPTVLGSNYTRAIISSIRFQDSLEGASEYAWDVSEAGDDSVLAWVDQRDLTIAGNGKIILPSNCSFLFAYYDRVEEIDFNGCVDTSNVTDMRGMFTYCPNLRSLDLSGFDTSNVACMGSMFDGCASLQSLDLSSFDTSGVNSGNIGMSSMFMGCKSLRSLDLSGFDTSNVTDMGSMFDDCRSLQSLDLRSFDTSNVTRMGSMFYGCTNLQSLDLRSFDTSNVTYMYSMFSQCEKLTDLRVSSGFVIKAGTTIEDMFYDCPLDMDSVTAAPTATPEPAPPMMREDPITGDGPHTVLGSSYERGSISSIRFKDSLAGAPADAWDASLAGDGSVLAWVKPNGDLYDLTIAGNGKVILPEDGYSLFAYYDHAKEIDFNGCVDTSNVIDMDCMFDHCESLRSLDLSGFDTSNTIDMGRMFYKCESLQSLDLSGFDTSNVTDMGSMFCGCASLQSLDLRSFDTSNVIIMQGLFNGCKGLTSLSLSNFDTSNVTDMSSMFYACENLILLDLRSFDTSNVTDMGLMFARCEILTELNTSPGFVINGNTNTDNMFKSCSLDRSDL